MKPPPPFIHHTHTSTFTHLQYTLLSKPTVLSLPVLLLFLILEILQAAESFFSSLLMWRERLVLPGRQKRRRNEGNERIARFLARSERGFLRMFLTEVVQFPAVKSYRPPTYTMSPHKVMYCGV